MKKLITTSILAALVAFATTVMAQDYPEEYLGLPGDNLNLYAVMKLFQESETLEGFERSLNEENSRINNLDLNGDNLIDYITVTDYVDRNVHTIVLRVPLTRNESQDVAVFTVEKLNNGAVNIQLIGDEALYGRNYIIEPIYDETPNPGYIGRPASVTQVTVVRTTPYQIATWPVIRFIYLPNYVTWRSSWYWGYYPPYWRPWRPYYWHYYYGYHYNWYHHYYTHYRYWNSYRYARYNDFYFTNIRVHSTVVVNNINNGSYKTTYSRPEQRRDGEALFTKSYPNRERRTAENTPVQRLERNTAAQTSRERAGSGATTGNARRESTSNANRAATRTEPAQNQSATRRAPSSVSKSEAGQSSAPARRTSTSVARPNANQNTNTGTSTRTRTQTSVSRPEAKQSTNTSTRTRTQTSVSRPEAKQSTSTSRRTQSTVTKSEPSRSRASARQSRQETRNAASTSRRTSNQSKSGTTTNKSSREKQSKETKSSERR